ncbi:MAG: GntR family transcriptional regulator [Fimbriimonas sp.]
MSQGYQQIAEELRHRIATGVYGSRLPLPSERALEQEFGIHRATVRRALSLLTDEGLLSRSPGRRAYTRSGAARDSRVIGLFAQGVTDSAARSIVAHGMSEMLGERYPSHRMATFPSTTFALNVDSREADPEVWRSLAGVVLWPPLVPAIQVLRDASREVPMVLIDLMAPGLVADFVGCDDLEGGYAAARHLYESGHRRLAFLGDLRTMTVQQRRIGMMRFCHDAGLDTPWHLSDYLGTFTGQPEPLLAAVAAEIKARVPIAAVCGNDEAAAYMISFFNRYGIRVPDDVALIGFGNSQPSLLDALGLTTLEQPYPEIGRLAIQMLMERIENPTLPPREVRLPMRLVVRSSSAA